MENLAAAIINNVGLSLERLVSKLAEMWHKPASHVTILPDFQNFKDLSCALVAVFKETSIFNPWILCPQSLNYKYCPRLSDGIH